MLVRVCADQLTTHLDTTHPMKLNINEAVRPTFSERASLFATNFTRHEQDTIPMRPMKSTTKIHRRSDVAYESTDTAVVMSSCAGTGKNDDST